MSFFGKMVTDFVKTAVSSISPFKIEEYSQDQYHKEFEKYDTMEQVTNFCLKKIANYYSMFYLPVTIVAPNNRKAFSLFRSQNVDESRAMFFHWSGVLAQLEICSAITQEKQGLERICPVLRDHTSWTAAHVAAKLGLLECFRTSQLATELNSMDAEFGMTPLHVGIKEGNADLVRELLVFPQSDVDRADNQANTVFHMAAAAGSPEIIKLLCSKSTSRINQLNVYGQSCLHLACENKNADCLESLLLSGADPQVNRADRSPVHIAVMAEDKRCVELLYRYSPRTLNDQDTQTGYSALHLAKTKSMVDCLWQLGIDMDTRATDGSTALSMKIREGLFDVALDLLIRGAEATLPDNEGNAPLHAAVQQDDISLLRALIVFEADVNAKNKNGDTSRHLLSTQKGKKIAMLNYPFSMKNKTDLFLFTLDAVGAQRCPSGKIGCADGCSARGTYNGSPPTAILIADDGEFDLFDSAIRMNAVTALTGSHRTSSQSQRRPGPLYQASCQSSTTLDQVDTAEPHPGYRVLSLDGGGIRGLVLVQMLRAIECISGRNIREIFDWIGGTSTGGLLALCITHGKTLKHCRSVYFNMKDAVFNGKRPYAAEPFEELIKKEFGEHTKMTDVSKPRVMVTGLLGDRFPPELHLFRNYDAPDLKVPGNQSCSPTHSVSSSNKDEYQAVTPPHEQLVWRACRATGAAPTFFRACGRFLDGGLMANNPTLDMLTEIQQFNLTETLQHKEPTPIGILVSLGTGRIPVNPVTQIDVFRPNNPVEMVKSAMGMTSLGKIIIEMATMSEGRVVERARAWCGSIGVPFFRFSPPISADVPLDCTDNVILLQMLWETQAYITRSTERFVQLATIL